MTRRSLPLALLLLSNALAACSGSKAEPLPIPPSTAGMDALGRGTDVFGKYATEDNKLGQILDVEAMNRARLLVFSRDIQEGTYEELSGRTIGEYSSAFGSKVGLSGKYLWFSGEIKSSYAAETYRKTGFTYSSIRERYYKHALKVEPSLWGSPDQLRPHLVARARQVINDTDPARSWSGAEVIAAYGTHLMNGIYVGGRLDYNLTIKILQEQYQQSLSLYVGASYKSTFASASGSWSVDDTTRTAMDSYERAVTIAAKGGSVQYARPATDADYQLWKASIDANPAFCGIVSGGLMGIWELADAPERQAALRQAFLDHAASQGASFVPLAKKITGLRVVDRQQQSSVTPTPPWTLLESATGDRIGASLNGPLYKDAVPANYIYIEYVEGLTDAPGVGEVHLSSTQAAAVDLFFGGTGGTGHDDRYGVGQAGCLDLAAVDLNAGTCGSAFMQNAFCGALDSQKEATCYGPGTPLQLHWALESAWSPPISCVVVGRAVATDYTQAEATRAANIWWGPKDANGDGTADAADATWVANHVRWVKDVNDNPINLNHGTQSYWRGAWGDCWNPFSANDWGYHDGWVHQPNAPEDALYLGYCVP